MEVTLMGTSTRRRRNSGGVSRYQTGNGARWRIAYTIDGSRFTERGFVSAEAARDAVADRVRAARERGTAVGLGAQMTLGQWCQQWLESLNRAPATEAAYARQVRVHIEPTLGRVRLRDLRPSRLRTWHKSLQSTGLSDSSVAHVVTVLRTALAAARDDGLISTNPASGLHLAKGDDHEPVAVWSADDVARFIAWANQTGERFAFLYELLAATGARRGEGLALTWADLPTTGNEVSITKSLNAVSGPSGRMIMVGPTKGRKRRSVAIDPTTQRSVRSARTDLVRRRGIPAPGDLVFQVKGKPIDPTLPTRAFRAAQRRYTADTGGALPPMSIHGLRHTHASLLLNAGHSPADVAERLGNSPAVLLRTYAHASNDASTRTAATFAALVHA